MTTETECTVDGVRYVQAPDTKGCEGCAGNGNSLCDALPIGCSVQKIIWVRGLADPRQEFENHAYAHYLQRKAAGKVDPTAEGDGGREALFWKQPDGSYGVLAFNAAWQGFKWGRGLS